ncbi:hypothetical protein L2E82_38166 [Cichorium intybus]|uniref:Uncharacterized protein n=1 Tax=Cichorium intybus TaxID=13427 RepID=A0ACB9AET7_CICIN|nr:hypothetical protein L2E82_38166 [Cichorium intybus]
MTGYGNTFSGTSKVTGSLLSLPKLNYDMVFLFEHVVIRSYHLCVCMVNVQKCQELSLLTVVLVAANLVGASMILHLFA